jgi:hypothetical protein
MTSTSGLLLVCLSAATPARASPSSALEQLSQQMATEVVSKGFAPPVGVFVESDHGPLGRIISSLFISKLAAARLAPVSVEAADAAEAERVARERGAASLVRLAVRLEGGKITVRGDALGTQVNFWSGAVPTRSGPAAALAFAVDADAQTRLLAGGAPSPAAPLELVLASIARLPAVPAAVAVADLDGDRKGEILALVEGRLWIIAADGKVLGKADFLGPPSLRPSREPFGAILVSDGRVLVWSAQRDRPELFEGGLSLHSAGAAEALKQNGLGLHAEVGLNRFLPEAIWAGRSITFPLSFQAFSAFGTMGLFCFTDGSAALVKGALPSSRVAGVGTGSTLADLDGDGSPEVIITTARTAGDTDEVRAMALGEFDAVQARGGLASEAPALWQQAIQGRAIVAAFGDTDGQGGDEVVLGIWQPEGQGELLLLKRVSR